MTISGLIKKLQEYPIDAELSLRFVSVTEDKIILVVDGFELDPVFQAKKPLIHGYGSAA